MVKSKRMHALVEINSLISEQIPTLPSVVAHILSIILDDRSSIKDLYEAVRVDQALVAKVLRVVNS
ncbi:MAG: HDOD domain-containing protein, partial [bacterium]|nr:HDOD domain-containing protein [bacterium]